MKEYVEFRIPEEKAFRFLKPNQGERLGDIGYGNTARKLTISVEDPIYELIGKIDQQLRAEGDYFFLGWNIIRKYSIEELESAKLFRLILNHYFEPPGEVCGTIFDESTACKICGAGRTQVTDLVLDLRKVPKSKDLASSIANEWIVSQRLAEILIQNKMIGFELHQIRHKAKYQDDPLDLKLVPTGRKILQLAEEAGISQSSWEFSIWLNQPKLMEMMKCAEDENTFLLERRAIKRKTSLPVWYQLVVTSKPAPTIPPTFFGNKPFDEDPEGEYKCPLGHVSGLNLLSELWISNENWDGGDIVQTENMMGIRRGLLVPSPLLLISPRLWKLLKDNNIKGYHVEVAHLI